MNRMLAVTCLAVLPSTNVAVQANPPVASYIFPAGGQRGTTVDVRVGGLFLNQRCGFEMLGPGVEPAKELHRVKTTWFEGPILPLPESQQAEDYPRDFAGRIRIERNAPLGTRSWRVWTSQGASSGPVRFMVGDLPEIVEQEIEGDPVPVEVKLPVTINGRIFPRENIDAWSFDCREGQTIMCEVHAARLGSPLDSRLEVLGPEGKRIVENDDAFGADSMVRFTATADGRHQVRIHDVQFRGGPAYVYRLTITADPHVDRVYPLGGRRGSKIAVELSGQALPREPAEIQLPADGPKEYAHRVIVAGKTTNPFFLDLDDLPEYQESEPNDTPAQANPLKVPAILNGRIGKPGDVDYWAVPARKGEPIHVEVRAGVLGSPLQAALAIVDDNGKELVRSDTVGQNKLDPSLQFTAPVDGTYYLRISDAFHGRGGRDFAYRIRLRTATEPDFRLRLAEDVVAVPRGGQAKVKLAAERKFAPGPITLTVDGLPPGMTAAVGQIAANQANGEITLKTDATARVQVARLSVRGAMKVGDRTLTSVATLAGPRGAAEVNALLAAVTLPTPFKVIAKYDMRWAPRGTVFHRRYQIERGSFAGPLEVSLADRQARHLQGVTGPTMSIPAGVTEFDYPLQLPPWMETGRTCRVCVMASGVIKETDGSEHTVSFSSIQPNEQIILVVEPGRLDLEAERLSFVAAAGRSIVVPVRVTRGKGLEGPVKVELIQPSHFHGVAAEPVFMREGKDRAELAIRFATDWHGVINEPLLLRATLMEHGEPVVAETKVEIVAKKGLTSEVTHEAK
jgi:hypothetical protein